MGDMVECGKNDHSTNIDPVGLRKLTMTTSEIIIRLLLVISPLKKTVGDLISMRPLA